MPISRNYHSHSSRLSLGERGLVPIPRYPAHVLLPTTISRMAATEYYNRLGFLTSSPPMASLFPFHSLEALVNANERIFKTQSRSQYSLIFSSVQAATKFHFLAGTTKRPSVQVPQLVSWLAPLYPYFKLNIDGSALNNSGLAGARGVLRNH